LKKLRIASIFSANNPPEGGNLCEITLVKYNFLPLKTDLGKTTNREKVDSLSKSVESDYVNRNLLSPKQAGFASACGKLCG